jgi:signal transduction histidine kinase
MSVQPAGTAPEEGDDPTERARRRLAEVEELSGIGSWEWHVERNELVWSEQLHRVYGVRATRPRFTFEDFLDRVHPEDRDAVIRTVTGALETGRSFETEHRALHDDGTVHVIFGRGYVLRGPSGQVERMLGSGQDVTDLRARERERTDEERRRAAGQARDEALALLAHDLRSPLSVAVGYVQLLERQIERGMFEPEKLTPYLERVNVAARQMTTLLEDLLADADPSAGSESMETEPVDLTEQLRATITQHDDISASHAVVGELPDGPVIVPVNLGKLERAVHNLIVNAIKYSPDGGTITVALEADADEARIRVSDEGIGIPAPDLPHVFERFHRGSNATGRTSGLGLGLISVKRAVEAHGGRVEVDSTEGEGTTFTVYLPR